MPSATRLLRLDRAISACLENGNRLLTDAEYLQHSEPPTTALALAIIAQEELAKAFLLHLVEAGVVPWSREVRRATRDHSCKQLLGLVIDFLNPETEEFLARLDAGTGGDRSFPAHVADAINIFRHEKVRRWESQRWVWAEDPIYDGKALKVAEGRIDREKQDALYVRLGPNGEVIAPSILPSPDRVRQELDRGRRFAQLIEDVLQGSRASLDYEEILGAFAAVFGRGQE